MKDNSIWYLIAYFKVQFSSVQFSLSVVSDSLRPHESQHAWPPCPSPTLKKSLQLCPILCDPVNCSLSGSSVHGILQEGILEWVAMPSSGGSSQPRDWTLISHVSWIGRRVLYHLHHHLSFVWSNYPDFCENHFFVFLCRLTIYLFPNCRV